MKKNDFIFAGVVLAISCMLLFFQKVGTLFSDDSMVCIYQGNEKLASYPLTGDRRESILSPEGGRNVIVIEKGEVYMEDADCPDKLCMKQGSISGPGQTIVCLPHKLVVTVENGKEPELDGVTG